MDQDVKYYIAGIALNLVLIEGHLRKCRDAWNGIIAIACVTVAGLFALLIGRFFFS